MAERTAAGDPAGPQTLGGLAEQLRGLRRRHARCNGDEALTYREIAGLTGWSHAAVGQYFSGRTLPPTGRFDVLITLLGATASEQRFLATARDRIEEAQRRGPRPRPSAAAVPVPRQLPAAPTGFAGRAAELDALDRLVDRSRQARSVVPCVVSGTAGVGKTTLAVHWAHTVAERFPHGQLYVNLRGFDPDAPVIDAAQAIRGFLDALGVSPTRVPAAPEDQVALYRTLIADRQILIVLDNARDAGQVRPLLPGTGVAVVVVTSRNQLTGLLAVDGAEAVVLHLLLPAEARDLLIRRLGPHRVAAEPDAAQRIITACAGLPLALAIVAARAQQTGFALHSLADQLNNAGQRLDALDAGEPASQVRAVFSWSSASLTPAAAQLFRLLGLHPGADLTVASAAGLAGRPMPETRRNLAELVYANLLIEHVPGRYTLHDLLRVYAGELCHDVDADEIRTAAVTRMFDHYGHTAYAAELLLSPARDPIELSLGEPVAGSGPQRIADSRAATAWFAAEHAVLLTMIRYAVDTGFEGRAWQLIWSLHTFLYRVGNWHKHIASWRYGLRAARALGNPAMLADAYRHLAHAETQISRHAEAHANLLHALELCRRADDPARQARTYFSLAYHWLQQGRPGQALDTVTHALELFRVAGNQQGQAQALNGAGWCHAQLGEHGLALTCCTAALAMFEQVGDLEGQANTWQSLGYAHHQLGQRNDAVRSYERAIALYQELGENFNEADVRRHLGDIFQADGDFTTAAVTWIRAWELFTRLGHPHAETVRARLRTLHLPDGLPRAALDLARSRPLTGERY